MPICVRKLQLTWSLHELWEAYGYIVHSYLLGSGVCDIMRGSVYKDRCGKYSQDTDRDISLLLRKDFFFL